MKNVLFAIFFIGISYVCFAQEEDEDINIPAPVSSFERTYFPLSFYPIGTNVSIGYLGNLGPAKETYIFEAHPHIKLALFNKIYKNMKETKAAPNAGFIQKWKKAANAAYANFRPQLRMFTDASLPVKMPSYRLGAGYQHMFSLNKSNAFGDLENEGNRKYIAFAFETGHYSNGQSGATLDENIIDGTAASDSLYSQITDQTKLSDIINRRSGNFSTNYTEILVKYLQVFNLQNDFAINWFSVEAGWTRYHNNLFYIFDIGGYSDNDIKLYGKNTFHFNLEYMYAFTKRPLNIERIKLNINYEYLHQPHPSVTRSRIEIIPSVYHKSNFGIYAKFAFGHDNYNLRFVDNVNHYGIGLTYDLFPSLEFAR